MFYAHAYGHIHEVLTFELPKLRYLASHGVHTHMHVYKLQMIRDELDAACRAYSAGNGDVEHAEFYLPLFDALALINEALIRRSYAQHRLKEAVQALELIDWNGGDE